MPTPMQTKSVANFFLKLGFEEEIEISPMKLQKLLFYAQGWHLGFTGGLLFDEQVECWRYGPVVRSIFDHFREFGSSPIDRLATKHKFVNGKWKIVYPKVPNSCNQDTKDILTTVWSEYKNYSAFRLSNMTHEEGGPWHTVFIANNQQPPMGTDIPIDVMRDYFKELVGA